MQICNADIRTLLTVCNYWLDLVKNLVAVAKIRSSLQVNR
jgi:hypothetical protein